MAKEETPTIRERWFVTPLKSGDIELGFATDKSYSASVSGGGVGPLVTAILLSACDAHAMSAQPDPPDPTNVMIPPLEPASIGFLNPQGNLVGMVMRFGRTDIVLNISNLDLADIGRALIALSASTETQNQAPRAS